MHEKLLEENKKFKIIYDRLILIVKYCNNYISVEDLTKLMSKHTELKYTHITTIAKDCKTLSQHGFLEFERRRLRVRDSAYFYKRSDKIFNHDEYVDKYDIIGKLARQKAQQAEAVKNFERNRVKNLEGYIEGARAYSFETLAENMLESDRLRRKENKKKNVGQFMGESSLSRF